MKHDRKYRMLRRVVTLLLIMSMMLSEPLVSLGLASEGEPENLLSNSSFDTSFGPAADPASLSTGAWSALSFATWVENEPDNAKTGPSLAHLVFNTPGLNAGEWPTLYQDVAVEKNTLYRVSFWAKCWQVNSAVQPMYYGIRNPKAADIWANVEEYSVSDLTNGYRELSFVFDSRDMDTVRLFACLNSIRTEGGFGGYHLDDFTMTKIRYVGPEEQDPDNLIQDGFFNRSMTALTGDGTALSEDTWTSMSWASRVEEVENARTGKGLANLVYNADGLAAGEFPTMYQDVKVDKNTLYEVSFYAKNWSVGDSSKAKLYYGYRNPKGEDVWVPVEQFEKDDTGSEYQEITFTFNSLEMDTVRIFAFVQSIREEGKAGGYHIDDFAMKKIRYVKPETPEQNDPDNLLKDGFFNQAMTVLSGDGTALSEGTWTSMSWVSRIEEVENAHTGKGLANLVYNADGLAAGEFPTMYQDVKVDKNTLYEVSFYAKNWSVGGSSMATLYYGYRNPRGEDVWIPVEQFEKNDTGSEYQKITFTFNSLELDTVRIFAFVQSIREEGKAGGYHIDDFTMKKLRYVAPEEPENPEQPDTPGTPEVPDTPEEQDPANLVADGCFNNVMSVLFGDGTKLSTGVWTAMSWASRVEEPENARTGKGLANLVYDAQGLTEGEYPTIYQDIAVEKNTRYQVEFYARNWQVNSKTAPLYYGYRDPRGEDVWVPVEQFETTPSGEEYQKVSFTFDSEDLEVVRIFAFVCSIRTQNGIGGYHIDDFSMYRIGPAPVETDDPGNLLKNGLFNEEMTMFSGDGTEASLGYWTSMSWASSIREPENAHGGKGLANLVYAAPGLLAGEFPGMYQDVNVEQNTYYRVSFYVKHWSGSESQAVVPLHYGYRDPLGRDVWLSEEEFEVRDAGNGYQEIAFRIHTYDMTRVRIFAFVESVSTGGIGGYHIDDFTMKKEGEAPGEAGSADNMIKNASFCDPMQIMRNGNDLSVGYWTSMSWVSAITERGNARSGRHLANLVYSAPDLPADEFPTMYQDVPVEQGTYYRVSFYVKRWGSVGTPATLYYGFRDAKGDDVWLPVEQYEISSAGEDYQQISFEFHSRDVQMARIFVFARSVHTDGIGGYHIDDFHMEKVGAFSNQKKLPVSPQVYDENLVHDPSFELGDSKIVEDPTEFADVWTMMSVAGVDEAYDFANTGRANLFMAYSAEGMEVPSYPTVWQDIEVKKDTWYEFSFYVKQFGKDAVDDKLYYGFRDPWSNDIWSNTQEYIREDFGGEYSRVTCKLYSGKHSVIRLFFCIVALDYASVGEPGGYHIDDVALREYANIESCDFTCYGDAILGERIPYQAVAAFDNQRQDVGMEAEQGVVVTFESSDENVITSDLMGNLIASGLGTAKVRMVIRAYGHEAVSKEQEVTVSESDGTPYIQKVSVEAEETLKTGEYIPLTFAAQFSDGTSVPTGSAACTVQSSDEQVVSIRAEGNEYFLYGMGAGEATVYVTVEKDGKLNVGKLPVAIRDGNLLRDSSIELQDTINAQWLVTGTAAGGLDTGSSNALSRTGYANFWLAAPVYWSQEIEPDSVFRIYQDVYLEPGSYELSAYINRFYATGPGGILAELGGDVHLGALPVDEEGNETASAQEAVFNVGYGVGKYQELTELLDVGTAGMYRVYVNVAGDALMGLGMQIDDVSLKPMRYPSQITAALVGSVYQNELTRLEVTAHYEDGAAETLTQGVSYTVEDETIASVAGNYVIGGQPGETVITAETIIGGQKYSVQIPVTIDGKQVIGDRTADRSIWVWILGITGIILIAGSAATVWICRKSAKQRTARPKSQE